jgi:hypothetical protein
MELQTVKVSLDTLARKLQENLQIVKADLTTDFTVVGFEFETTRNKISRSNETQKKRLKPTNTNFRVG